VLARVVAVAAIAILLTAALGNLGTWSHDSTDTSDTSREVAADSFLVTRMLADLRAGRKPEHQDRPLAGAPVTVVRASPKHSVPLGELRIPAIGLRTPVFEGVNEDALREGPGHWPGTPGPGEPGNSVLSGHRSTETRPFLYLDRLSAGDRITITRGGEVFRYAVDDVTIVPQAGYVRYVLQKPANPRTRMVTLFACNPLTAHYERIVVRARALDGGRPS
jgi:sortase A